MVNPPPVICPECKHPSFGHYPADNAGCIEVIHWDSSTNSHERCHCNWDWHEGIPNEIPILYDLLASYSNIVRGIANELYYAKGDKPAAEIEYVLRKLMIDEGMSITDVIDSNPRNYSIRVVAKGSE